MNETEPPYDKLFRAIQRLNSCFLADKHGRYWRLVGLRRADGCVAVIPPGVDALCDWEYRHASTLRVVPRDDPDLLTFAVTHALANI